MRTPRTCPAGKMADVMNEFRNFRLITVFQTQRGWFAWERLPVFSKTGGAQRIRRHARRLFDIRGRMGNGEKTGLEL